MAWTVGLPYCVRVARLLPKNQIKLVEHCSSLLIAARLLNHSHGISSASALFRFQVWQHINMRCLALLLNLSPGPRSALNPDLNLRSPTIFLGFAYRFELANLAHVSRSYSEVNEGYPTVSSLIVKLLCVVDELFGACARKLDSHRRLHLARFRNFPNLSFICSRAL